MTEETYKKAEQIKILISHINQILNSDFKILFITRTGLKDYTKEFNEEIENALKQKRKKLEDEFKNL